MNHFESLPTELKRHVRSFLLPSLETITKRRQELLVQLKFIQNILNLKNRRFDRLDPALYTAFFDAGMVVTFKGNDPTNITVHQFL